MEMHVAVQGGSSELGPPRLPSQASSSSSCSSSSSSSQPAQQGLQDVIKREGQFHIMQRREVHTNLNKASANGFISMKAGEFRNRKVAAIKHEGPLQDLRDWAAESGIRSYCLAAVGSGCEGLLFDTPKSRLKQPARSQAGVPSERDVAAILNKMQSESECFSTVKVVRKDFEAYSKEDILEMARPYVGMNGAEFQAELIAIGTRDPCALSREEKFILANQTKITKLRAAILELDLAKSYLVFPGQDDSIVKKSDFTNLEKLKTRRKVVDKVFGMAFERAILMFLETCTFIFGGPNNMGKTPLAKRVAADYAQARGVSYFAMSSTVDSLRMLSVQGFFRPHTAVVLDEWRMGADSQDSQGHKADFIKCLTDVESPGAVRLRYSDVRFASLMPRIITSQARMKDWLELLAKLDEADAGAVLKRVIFVDFDEPVVPVKTAEAFRTQRADNLQEAFKAIGMTVPADGTLGGWVEVKDE